MNLHISRSVFGLLTLTSLTSLPVFSQSVLLASKTVDFAKIADVAPPKATTTLVNPVRCDKAGNVYYRNFTATGPSREVTRVSQDGSEVSLFSPDASEPNNSILDFAVSGSGFVYLLQGVGFDTQLLSFQPDGTLLFKVKLQMPGLVIPHKLALFSSGRIFVYGTKLWKEQPGYARPFMGIFNSDGTFVKKVVAEEIPDGSTLAAVNPLFKGDSPRAVIALALTPVASFDDTVYIVDPTLTPELIAISSEGKILSHSSVPGMEPGFVVTGLKTSGISAVLEMNSNGKNSARESRYLTYSLINKVAGSQFAMSGVGALACYSDEGSMTFLKTSGGSKLSLIMGSAH